MNKYDLSKEKHLRRVNFAKIAVLIVCIAMVFSLFSCSGESSSSSTRNEKTETGSIKNPVEAPIEETQINKENSDDNWLSYEEAYESDCEFFIKEKELYFPLTTHYGDTKGNAYIPKKPLDRYGEEIVPDTGMVGELMPFYFDAIDEIAIPINVSQGQQLVFISNYAMDDFDSWSVYPIVNMGYYCPNPSSYPEDYGYKFSWILNHDCLQSYGKSSEGTSLWEIDIINDEKVDDNVEELLKLSGISVFDGKFDNGGSSPGNSVYQGELLVGERGASFSCGDGWSGTKKSDPYEIYATMPYLILDNATSHSIDITDNGYFVLNAENVEKGQYIMSAKYLRNTAFTIIINFE